MAVSNEDYEEMEWSSYSDVVLLNSLVGFRPIGANYHICMTAVWHRFCTAMGKNVSMECVEKRISKFYNLKATNGIVDENGVFTQESEFALPSSDFPEVGSLAKEREASSRKSSKTAGSTDSVRGPISKTVKKIVEIRSSEKPPRRSLVEDDKRTPAKKRPSRLSEKSTPASKRGRN